LEFVKFACERENMLLHIFVWKRRRRPKRPAATSLGRKSRELAKPVENQPPYARIRHPMNKPYFHHVLIASDDLERSRQFYSGVLELEEINRPAFAYPGIWYKIGDGQQQLHIIVRSEATIRRNKSNDPNDIHFALRMESYRDTLAWLRNKGFRDDVFEGDLRKMELLPTSLAGWPQIYILDPDRNIIEFSFETVN
jgi:glyoxylase I family protein